MADALGDGDIVYGGFWERFAALLLDGLLLWIVNMVVFGVLTAAYGFGMLFKQTQPMSLVLNLSPWLISACYFVWMESGERGATFGKRALKLRVVDSQGQRISRGRAAGRWVAHALSYITLLIGYLIQPFTGRKQALHDMVAGTLVIKTDKNSSGLVIILGIVGAFFALIIGMGIVAALAVPQFEAYMNKSKMMQVMQADVIGRAAAKTVQDYAAKTGKVPATVEEAGFHMPKAPFISRITVIPSGQMRVIFSASAGAKIAGKALVFDPSRDAKGNIVWKCSGPGIPVESLSPDCR